MSGAAKKISVNIAYAVCSVAIVLGVWAIGAAAVGSKFVLPGLGDTFRALRFVLQTGAFWRGLLGTLGRSAIGFVAAFVLFAVLFALSVSYAPARRIIAPVVSALRTLPAVAVTLILILSVGSYGAPIALGVLVIMPIMYAAAWARATAAPKELLELNAMFGASKAREFGSVWFPSVAGALPEILSTAFSYNVKAVIGAEILAQTANSLGMLMNVAQQYLQTAMLIAYVAAAVIVSVALEFVIRGVLGIVLRKYRY